MIEAAIDALVAAAPAGVDLDGLEVEGSDGGYRFAVPGTERTDLDEPQLRAIAREHDSFVLEWYYWRRVAPQQPARWAFLRWLEGADDRPVPRRQAALGDGVAREWGELSLRVSSEDPGRRRYAVRHRDDAERPADALAVHDDPSDAHELARFDEDGTYRPLSTAPTLQRGWVFPDLEPHGLLATVEAVYPATIANWHLEREGELDVTHWRAAAERQTGIYDVVDELAGEQVAWLAEACCVDSQCLKRREWDEAEAEPLDVPRGEGQFPCREPCSFVVAAAREIAVAERDPAEPVELHLSPAERAQLERIVGAVAEGEAGAVREGDFADGANRLRVRYLRAKHGGLFEE